MIVLSGSYQPCMLGATRFVLHTTCHSTRAEVLATFVSVATPLQCVLLQYFAPHGSPVHCTVPAMGQLGSISPEASVAVSRIYESRII